MKNKAFTILLCTTLLVMLLYFFFDGLVRAKAFLAPVAVAAILAMVVLPVANWLEHKGMSRVWASISSGLLILFFFVVLTGILAFQVKRFSQDWPQMKQKIEPKIQDLQEYIAEKTGLSIQEQQQKVSGTLLGGSSSQGTTQPSDSTQTTPPVGQSQAQSGSQGQNSSGMSSVLSTAGSFIMKFIGFIGTCLITLVYIFFFLLYRKKFKDSIIKMVPEEGKKNAANTVTSAAKVSQSYLSGRLIEIVILAIVYSIGLIISGVPNAILISILAAVLVLIPYLGNVIGYLLALAFALFSGGGMSQAIGVSITFGLTQFIETYTLEPYLVGGKVNLNPVVTILVVVLGNALWGIVGMLVAIPALGIAKVIFDHVPVLHPLAYMLGEEDSSDDDGPDFFEKTKRWVTNKF